MPFAHLYDRGPISSGLCWAQHALGRRFFTFWVIAALWVLAENLRTPGSAMFHRLRLCL